MKKFLINDKRLMSILAFVLCLMMTGFIMFTSPVFSVKAEETTAEESCNFVFVCPNKSHEYWTPLIENMRKADEKLGTNTEVVGPDTYDNWAENLITNLSAVLDRENKPDGLLVRGVEGMADLINRAVDMGIPVVTVDTDVPASKRVAYVGSDSSALGKKAAQAVIAHVPEGSELGMVMTSSDRTDIQFELRGAFENIVNDYGMTVTATAYLNTEDGKEKSEDVIVNEIKAMLSAHPDIKAIFTTGAVNAAYAAKAKVELGLNDLFIIGQDDTEDNLDYVRSDVIHAVVAQRTDLMGYLSVINLKKYIDTGSLPKKIYDTGITLVTKDNVDTYKDLDLDIATEVITVKVGYYEEKYFQEGGDADRKSGYAYDYYQMLAPFANWKYEYVFGTKADMLQKLKDGTVDVVAGVYKSASADYDLIEMGLNDDEDGERCFAVKKGSELLKDLQYAIGQIDEFFPAFTMELYQKYYNRNSVHTTLTNRESQWLIERNILHFGYVSGLLPFSDRDENGDPIGLAGDLVRMLEEFTEIDIVPVCYNTVSDLETALQNGEADVGFPTRRDTWLAETKGLQQSNAIVTDRMMIVYSGSYTSEITNRIAYVKNSLAMKEYLEINYPSSELTVYGSFEDMLEAVYSGKEKCIIGYSSILQRRLSGFDDYDQFNISYLNTSEDLCFSINRDNGILTVILNKMINQLNQEVLTGTLMQYARINTSERITFGEFFKSYAYIFAIVFAAVFIVLLVTFVFYSRRAREHSRRQREMQAALEKAVEAAESASKAKTNFLSSMSHDIRTPMNAIVGMTGIAKKHTDDPEKLNDCLDKITLSGQHLLTLINDVLDISKIESGKFVLSPINFSLRRVVDNLVNIARPMIKDKAQEFDIHIHDVDCETLYGDELRISQIFINILSNAVKYTPNGGKIVLDLCEERVNEQTVRLTYIVKDTGIGMSAEYMEHMYDTFSRATDNRTSKIQGTGLGLAIVKQMVTLMGGTINCESEPDKGTTFTIKIELPVGEVDNKNYTLPPIDILLVDDDDVFLAITEDVINEMGAKTETACSGKKAIELVQSRHESHNDYDVVIVDWKMPELSGIETVRSIRDIVGDKTSIILVSAYDWSDIENDAKNSGADGFISKPLFKSYLSERIGSIIKSDKSKTVAESVYYDLEGLNILVAEDNELNWEVISELLDMYGITAERAENGKIAVEMMRNASDGKYDLILMDVQMPVMNGREATAEMRKSSREYIKNIPIIAMTADAFAEDIAACLAAGMNAHVSKPVDMNKLCQTIRHVLFDRDE